tara:strand:+ start:692 stop:901 length:210 start_codon:yes stop_codon:yes gene_type:complete
VFERDQVDLPQIQSAVMPVENPACPRKLLYQVFEVESERGSCYRDHLACYYQRKKKKNPMMRLQEMYSR